jgi:prepilin-type N-terminal cleavage/methylation domain-containing protein/prepilin-type processing-associated H-X9-DG protein
MSVRYASRPAKAFTLVELLVVIGIIAILVGVLLPALNRARNQALTVQCLANLRQIGQGIINYESEYRGYIIPVNYQSDGANNTISWAALLVWGHYVPHADYLLTGNTRVFTHSVFYCPAGLSDITNGSDPGPLASSYDLWGQRPDRFGVDASLSDSSIQIDCWYGINGAVYPSRPTQYQTIWHTPTNAIPCHASLFPPTTLPRISQIKHSSEMALIYDGTYCNLWSNTPTGTGAAGNGPFRIQARHGIMVKGQPEYTNILFVDGHCESVLRVQIPGGGYDPNPSPPGPALGGASYYFNNSNPLPLAKSFPYPKWRTDE